MAQEIEHKYLVIDSSYKLLATDCLEITQGYIDRTPRHVVRIRRKNNHCFLTIKGETKVDTRAEFEYEIPLSDFSALLTFCSGRIIRKRRWLVPFDGFVWEVDEFFDDLSPLVIAEIEIPTSGTHYALPPFVGENVTCNPAYYNANLAAM